MNIRRELYVSISRSTSAFDDRGCYVPEYSGRGPSPNFSEVLMPDLVAPGCNILASHPKSIPIGSFMEKKKSKDLFHKQKAMTGTSLANAHVAGLFTALISNRPQWSVATAKSAAITTARSFLVDKIPGDGFMFGAGLMQLKEALNPVLVYDETHANFESYAKKKLDVYKLNLPAFAASYTQSHRKCKRTFYRRLKNIDERNVEYKFEVIVYENSLDKEAIFDVSPSTLKFSPGDEQRFTMTVTLCPCPMGHLSALLVWKETSTDHILKSPIHLYHKSAFDRRIWYEDEEQVNSRIAFDARQDKVNAKGKEKIREDNIKDKGQLSGNEGVKITGIKRSR